MSPAESEITLHLELINATLGILFMLFQLAAEIRRKRQSQACSSNSLRFRRSTRSLSLRIPRFAMGVALAMLMAFLGAELLFGLPWSHSDNRSRALITGAGDLREVKLCEHTLNINQNSSLILTEGRSDCRVTLKSGEAAFLTGKTNRPLTVYTPQATIRGDLGLFGVKTAPGGTDITTSSEGRETSISCLTPNGHTRTLTLHADQSVHIGNDCGLQLGRVANIRPPDLSPREELRFQNASLVDALSDFNEYYQKPIRVDAESLLDEKISGAFNPLDQPTLLKYLKEAHGLRAVRTKDGGVRLNGNANVAAIHAQ